jgi:MtN3 and saliva related transmembrane protein
MFASGVALWLVYGLIIENWPLILTNALTLAFALSILIMKIHQTNSKKDIESN